MREILVIGIGAGNPEYITVQAINALNAADVFFVVDKGEDKSGLLALRTEICDRYVNDRDYRLVAIPEPPRDREAAAYADAVRDWHERRAELVEAAIIEHLAEDGRGAFLVWGDPALYDSTPAILADVLARGGVSFEVEIVPAGCPRSKNQPGRRTASMLAPRLSRVRAAACQALTTSG